MSYDSERSGIQSHFLTEWAILYPSWDYTKNGQVGFENHTFEPPADNEGIRLTILDGPGNNASIGDPGSNLVRNAGSIMVEIYVPAADTLSGYVGEKRIRELAEEISGVFINKNIGNVKTYVPFLSGKRDQSSLSGQWLSLSSGMNSTGRSDPITTKGI